MEVDVGVHPMEVPLPHGLDTLALSQQEGILDQARQVFCHIHMSPRRVWVSVSAVAKISF